MHIVNWIFDEILWAAIPFVLIMLFLRLFKASDTGNPGVSNSNSEYYSSGIDLNDK